MKRLENIPYGVCGAQGSYGACENAGCVISQDKEYEIISRSCLLPMISWYILQSCCMEKDLI